MHTLVSKLVALSVEKVIYGSHGSTIKNMKVS